MLFIHLLKPKKTTLKRNTTASFFLACLMASLIISCKENNSEPQLSPAKGYYSFHLSNPADPLQPVNRVGFDTLAFRAEDGSTRLLANRTLSINDYDTTVVVNLPGDRLLEAYVKTSRAQKVSIEVGLIDKSGSKRQLTSNSAGSTGSSPGAVSTTRISVRRVISLQDIKNVSQ